MGLRADIEVFHLIFIRSFLSSQDKSLVVLKGGCNLRFFLGSNRYSEDIDFDVMTIARDTLKRRVDKVLTSQALASSLAARKIQIVAHTAPKQTDTVQRWKATIRAQGLDIPTKIEFSRRGIDREGAIFESVDAQVLTEHRLTPTFLSHYNATYAVMQKIEALAGRPETQARDVFDLDLLLSRHPALVAKVPAKLIQQATECAMSVDFDQFRGQVVEFLAPDAQAYYSNPNAWETLQNQVIRKLESLGS